MSNSLLTGVTGLIAHQRMLDVVGHNIANLNTNGYKSQQTLFSDLFYENISSPSGATAARGGINGSQIGQGVRLSQVDRDFSSGTLEATGGQYDLAIEGDGFFVVNSGGTDVFTRAGGIFLGCERHPRLTGWPTGTASIRRGVNPMVPMTAFKYPATCKSVFPITRRFPVCQPPK